MNIYSLTFSTIVAWFVVSWTRESFKRFRRERVVSLKHVRNCRQGRHQLEITDGGTGAYLAEGFERNSIHVIMADWHSSSLVGAAAEK
jgi:hypothetical protein